MRFGRLVARYVGLWVVGWLFVCYLVYCLCVLNVGCIHGGLLSCKVGV